MRILEVIGNDPGPVRGVRDHAESLAAYLRSRGDQAEVLTWPGNLPDGHFDVVHLHYVPFMFSRYGLGAVSAALELGRQRSLVVTVHEPRVPYKLHLRELVLAPLQEVVLGVVARRAQRVIVPTKRWLPFLRGVRAVVIPSGSGLPAGEMPATGRHSGSTTVAIIASGHEGRMQKLAVQAARAAAARNDVQLLSLGQGSTEGFRSTGYLGPSEFAHQLRQVDVLALPYLDGVSGRRSSFASAMQMGVPTVTTSRMGSPDFPLEGACECAPVDEPQEFIARVVSLSGDAPMRDRLRLGSRELYERELAHGVLRDAVRQVYLEVAA